MALKYKLEIIESENGIFTLVGYIWEGPYIWRQDMTKMFYSIQEVAAFLVKGYK